MKAPKMNYFFELTNSNNLYFYKSRSSDFAEDTYVSKYFGPFTSLSALKKKANKEIDDRTLNGDARAYLRFTVRTLKVEDITENMEDEIARQEQAEKEREQRDLAKEAKNPKAVPSTLTEETVKPTPKADEFFNYVGCAFNVTKANELVERLKVMELDIEAYRRMIFPAKREKNKISMCMIHIDEEHAKKVNTSKPIIIATLEFDGNPTHVVIDGNHRVFKRLWIEDKNEIQGYVLTPEETLQIMVGPLRETIQKELRKKGKV